MAEKKGSSSVGLFGKIEHFDENGNKIAESRPTLFGGYDEYDAEGNKIGESKLGLFGKMEHFDLDGNKIGRPGKVILVNMNTMTGTAIRQERAGRSFMANGMTIKNEQKTSWLLTDGQLVL